MTHLAYNGATGEILTANGSGRAFKRWVARHTANDIKWLKTYTNEPIRYDWRFAHGGNYDECVAKLTVRHIYG